jgi:hypothetical protein
MRVKDWMQLHGVRLKGHSGSCGIPFSNLQAAFSHSRREAENNKNKKSVLHEALHCAVIVCGSSLMRA